MAVVGGAGKGIQIVVGADYNDRDLKRAQRDLDRLKAEAARTAGPMAKLGNTLRANVGPALAMAGAAAAALAVKFGVDGVKAAVAEQAELVRLEQALRNVGQAFAMDEVNTFIDDLQRATGVADSELRPAFQRLITATGDVAKAQDLLRLSMDISAGSGRSLESVSLAMAKASTGQVTALRRLGVPLSDAAVKSGDLSKITQELTDAFGGQAAAAANTYQGQIKRLGVAFGEVQESFGKGFLDGLGNTNDTTDDLMDSFKSLEPVMYSLGENIGLVAQAMGDLEKETRIVSGTIKGLLDITGPTTDAMLYLYRVFGQGEDPVDALKAQFFGISTEAENAAKGTGAYWKELLTATGATQEAISPTEEMVLQLEEEAAAAEKAAAEFDKLSAAISNTGAVMAYQKAMDDLRKTVEENNGATSIFNDKGRDTVGAYVDLAQNAGKYIETLTSQADKAAVAEDALTTLKSQLGKTKMDPETEAALLAPFQGLIDDLRESGVDVTNLQTKLNNLKSKNIDITTTFYYYGEKPVPMAVGGSVRRFAVGTHASDSIPAMLSAGEYVVRADAVRRVGVGTLDAINQGRRPTGNGTGVMIENLNVTAAPGERAEESVPRALRRYAFVAGLNG